MGDISAEKRAAEIVFRNLWIANIKRPSLRFSIATAITEAVEAERADCAEDVCMYCGERALGYELAEGPNEAGNWVHKPKSGGAAMLCKATAIHSRMRFIEALALAPEPEGE